MKNLEKNGMTIKLARISRGLRQVDVADQVGISEIYVSKIETGRYWPSQDVLERLANVVGLDVGDLGAEASRRKSS